MGKYFTVTVKPTIDAAAIQAGNFSDSEIIFDWFGFDVPRGASRLIGVTLIKTGKNGVDQTSNDVELFFAKSINGAAPTTLGDDGAAVDTFGWFPHLIGKTFIDGTNGANDGDLIMGNVIVAGTPGGGTQGSTNENNKPINNALVLEGEPHTGVNVGFDKIYVAGLAKTGVTAFGPSTMTIDAGAVDTSPVLPVADLSPILSGVGPGDILRDQDGLLLGTVKSVDSSAQITMEDNLANASAEDKLVVNTTPMTFIFSFEK